MAHNAQLGGFGGGCWEWGAGGLLELHEFAESGRPLVAGEQQSSGSSSGWGWPPQCLSSASFPSHSVFPPSQKGFLAGGDPWEPWGLPDARGSILDWNGNSDF